MAHEAVPGDCSRVLRQMREVPDRAPTVSQTSLFEGICLCKALKWPEARAKLRPYAEQQRSSATAWYWLDVSELYLKNFEPAREAISRAVELNPKEAESVRALGEAELELHHNDAAYRAWLKANELKPDDARTL